MDLSSALAGPAPKMAERLLGCRLIREVNGQILSGKIVETEAYDQTDAASHSYRGITPRTSVMFGPAGYLYVYFTYGMHFCCNVVVGQPGHGSAVLIRALEPESGIEVMQTNRRPGVGLEHLANGPAKVCQALAIDRALNGHNLALSPLRLELLPRLPKSQIIQTTRVGIRRDTDRPWRFYVKDSDYISRL